jgi:electron transfer flavoprotein-quinone oxidoreductase
VVLLADGINSPLAAKTGFRPEPSPDHVALAVKEVIELPEDIIEERFNVDHQNGVTIEILGDVTYGMNGVAVIYTNRKSLSLCIGANLADLAAGRIKPYDMMEAFKKHPMVAPLIKGGKPVEYMAHWLPEGGILIYRTFAATDISLPETRPCFFNTLHREGSNLAMISGTFAAEAILEAREKRDFGRHTLNGYLRRLERSVVLRDLKKYRHFNSFLQTHKEIFTTLPQAAGFAAREMLTVNGVPKKEKQKLIWRNLRKRHSLSRLTRLLVDAFRGMGCRLP